MTQWSSLAEGWNPHSPRSGRRSRSRRSRWSCCRVRGFAGPAPRAPHRRRAAAVRRQAAHRRRDVAAARAGRPAHRRADPIAVDDLRITDPEGTVVLDVPHLDARVRLRSLLKGNFAIETLRVPQALWRFAQLKHSDGIGFMAALAPKTPPTKPPQPQRAWLVFRDRRRRAGRPDRAARFPGRLGAGAAARARARVAAADQRRPAPPVLRFRRHVGGRRGGRRAAGPGRQRVPLDRIVINRIATTRERPDDIVLDLAGADTGRSRLSGKRGLHGHLRRDQRAGHRSAHRVRPRG